MRCGGRGNAGTHAFSALLAGLNPASRKELTVRDASINDLMNRLPEGVAVIDFARLDDLSYVEEQIDVKLENGANVKRLVKTPRLTPAYNAFLLRPDRQRQPTPSWNHSVHRPFW